MFIYRSWCRDVPRIVSVILYVNKVLEIESVEMLLKDSIGIENEINYEAKAAHSNKHSESSVISVTESIHRRGKDE